MSSCWAPQGIRPSIPSHYMREYRYCYGAVDAQTGDSFFLIAGGCNTEWTNEFLRQVSQVYPDDYIFKLPQFCVRETMSLLYHIFLLSLYNWLEHLYCIAFGVFWYNLRRTPT